jgi:hypothetical protein
LFRICSSHNIQAHPGETLLGVGGAALLLLFVGIHNAWDSVTYHVTVHRQSQHGEKRPG